jgi:GTP:adenosylcobinamide-phosphate guanylyltransferase
MIAFIPARYDSSRFPGKVLIEIGGKPLINHVVENAAKCDYISEVVVLTDDPRIVEAVSKVDFTKVRIVDSTLGHSGSDRVHRYLMKNNINDPFIIIQADCPDLDPMLLNGILAGLVTDTSFPIHTLAYSFLSDDKYDDPERKQRVRKLVGRLAVKGFKYFVEYRKDFDEEPHTRNLKRTAVVPPVTPPSRTSRRLRGIAPDPETNQNINVAAPAQDNTAPAAQDNGTTEESAIELD